MKKITRSVVTNEIYGMIKEQILHHKLQPGEKINIDQLARELEVSNIPIRESLSRLTAEGLVKAVPFKGMFVTHMTVKELDEIFEVRLSLEMLAIRKSYPVLKKAEIMKVLNKWKKINPSQERTFEENLKIVARMNEDFHGLYLSRCGNDTLHQLVKLFIERIQRYLLILLPEQHNELLMQDWFEHLEVLTALAEGDFDRAQGLLECHLNNSHARTRKLFIDSNQDSSN